MRITFQSPWNSASNFLSLIVSNQLRWRFLHSFSSILPTYLLFTLISLKEKKANIIYYILLNVATWWTNRGDISLKSLTRSEAWAQACAFSPSPLASLQSSSLSVSTASKPSPTFYTSIKTKVWSKEIFKKKSNVRFKSSQHCGVIRIML